MGKNRFFLIIIISLSLLFIFGKLLNVYAISQYGSNGEEVKQFMRKIGI